jgi:hypothetical protein
MLPCHQNAEIIHGSLERTLTSEVVLNGAFSTNFDLLVVRMSREYEEWL